MLPRAPRRRCSCNDGEVVTSWFDIARLPISAKSRKHHHGCSMEEAVTSCGRVHAAIDALMAEGIPPERIVVGGFSQGGAMAILSTLTYPKRLGGVIVFSGICFFKDLVGKLAEPHQGLQVFWGHGTRDEVLHADLQDEGVDLLMSAGLQVTARKYPVEHAPSEDELRDAAAFFSSVLTCQAEMQPLVYLAVRGWLGWIQFVERSRRAFLNSSLVLVAAGAVHCWAVVYSLFVAVHTRAMRYGGYHAGSNEQLPSSVALTETLAVSSLWVWLIAGFTTAAVRMLDEDADGLPLGTDDLKWGPILRFIRSPFLHSALGHAHSVSCAGLFVSIIFLCATMAAMKGGITVCESCLAIVAIGFAVPHMVLAGRRLSESIDQALSTILPDDSFEAAAAEAASLGPQLCVLLSLADAPGHAYWWQNIVYTAASMAFVAAVVASGRSPAKMSNVALPPEKAESFVCLGLDATTSLAIVMSYPQLNTWYLRIGVVAVIACAVAAQYSPVRDIYLDWLEPIFVIRSDSYKRVPNFHRQALRAMSWGAAGLCAVVALWDIALHPLALAAASASSPDATATASAESAEARRPSKKRLAGEARGAGARTGAGGGGAETWRMAVAVDGSSSQLLPVGPYGGETFESVMQNDPEYCQSVLSQENLDPELQDFARFLRAQASSSKPPSADAEALRAARLARFG
ncbi:unnamed protein product [Effrenium voratum]|nr:unnamed protein product [Effrenium voratum]